MNILLLSLGGGGGNILRSLKSMFRRDLMVSQKADAKYADRLRRAISTRFLDTNEFSLSDVPREERLLIGARTTGRLGARHDPELARQALEESKSAVEGLLVGHSVVIVIATGGKGTGAGTMFPVCRMARQQRKLVIPIFVRPSFERHEVDKRRFDHALEVVQQFDQAGIRLIEILNDLGYADHHPEPQFAVWEQMNLPIARGLRGLLYVLSDLSQVDPSDLSTLFAGPGRLRIGFAEIDPAGSHEPDDSQVQGAIRGCWQNPYYAFSKPVGTSLICIQGDWSNVIDARIKGGLATLAEGDRTDHLYNPLYARAPGTPKPWGVTALFAEHTGNHPPLAIDWTLERRAVAQLRARDLRNEHANMDEGEIEPAIAAEAAVPAMPEPEPVPAVTAVNPPEIDIALHEAPAPSFANLKEFAVAVNRSEPAALALAANGAALDIPIDGAEIRRLLGTPWFRAVVPRLSTAWQERLLESLAADAPLPDHPLTINRQAVRLSQLSYPQLSDLFSNTYVAGTARADLELLLIVGKLWGPEALGRFQFVAVPETAMRSRLTSVLGLRR